MSGIYHKNKVWANVTIPNPQDAATADLEKVKIDGTTYNISGVTDRDYQIFDHEVVEVVTPDNKITLATWVSRVANTLKSIVTDHATWISGKVDDDQDYEKDEYNTTTHTFDGTVELAQGSPYDFADDVQDEMVTAINDHAGVIEGMKAIAEKSDTDPYIYRPSVANGDRVSEDIVGASVGWNQLAPTNAWATSGIFTNNGDGSYTINGTITSAYFPSRTVSIPTIKGHKYLLSLGIGSSTNDIYITINGVPSSENIKTSGIITHTSDSFIVMFALAGTYNNVKVWPNVIDLTLDFGTTIADHIYSLEQATAGAGVAFFRKYFSKSYYPYNAGELLSVEVGGKKYVGKNLIDESQLANASGWTVSNGVYSGTIANMYVYANGGLPKQPKYFEKTVYTFRFKVVAASGNSRFRITYTDGTYSDAVITSSSAGSYVTTITEGGRTVSNISFTYNSGGNISISEMQLELGSPATTYTPYHLTTYNFPSQTLRGLFTLVNGELKASGDVYGDDGVVTRKYGVVDLGDYSWIYSNNMFVCSDIPNLGAWSANVAYNMICSKYPTTSFNARTDKTINRAYAVRNGINILDSAYTDAATFKTAMSGVYLVYELATSTTEQAKPLVMPQICDKNGTEEFITDGIVPVGHESTYYKYPDYMEEGEYKDFRDRVDYAPERAKWKKITGLYHGDTFDLNIIKQYTEIRFDLHVTLSFLGVLDTIIVSTFYGITLSGMMRPYHGISDMWTAEIDNDGNVYVFYGNTAQDRNAWIDVYAR